MRLWRRFWGKGRDLSIFNFSPDGGVENNFDFSTLILIDMDDSKKKLTWKEFRNMEVDENDHSIYELIDGVPKRKSYSDTALFSKISDRQVFRNLSEKMGAFLKAKPIGEYFYAPSDVFLDDDNGVVPDLSFVSKERDFLIENGSYIAGPPDLIVEIISPGSIKRDRKEIKDLYEKFSVKEFWLIDPVNRTVEIYLMKNDAYHLHAILEKEGELSAHTIEGFKMKISELFA